MKKKIVIAVVSLFFIISITIGVVFFKNSENNIKLNVEDYENYIMKFVVRHPLLDEQYIFVLTEENNILAQYKNADGDFEELSVKSDAIMIDLMKPYIDEVLMKTGTEIEGYANFTDGWYVNLYYGEKEVFFDYGASECNAVNILLEQIIGCCKFRNANKENLQPVGVHQREFMELYVEQYNNDEFLNSEEIEHICCDYINENYPEINYQSIEKFLEGIYTYESYEEKLSELIGPISDKYYNCYICMFVLENSNNEPTAITELYVDRITGKVKGDFVEYCIAGYVH